MKLLVSPLFCKAGGSEVRSLVKVKETSKRNFPTKLKQLAPQSERGPAAKKLPLGCSKLRPSRWTSQLNRLGLFRGTPNTDTESLNQRPEARNQKKPESRRSYRGC